MIGDRTIMRCNRNESMELRLLATLYMKVRMYDTGHSVANYIVLTRRLSDRIRELCTKAANVGDANFAEVLCELQTALREHAARTREMGIKQIVGRRERRRQKEVEESARSI